MPITVEIIGQPEKPEFSTAVFSYFNDVDTVFSTYKENSEISRINRQEIEPAAYSQDMQEVFRLCEETKKITNGYFDIKTKDGTYDPSGLVKGWAIYKAAQLLQNKQVQHFYIEAGGDIQASGNNSEGKPWRVGIRNPFNQTEIVKAVFLQNQGMATSGTYIRGQHIYNPHDRDSAIADIISLTVIGKNVYEADRFATAAFAMGKKGIEFIQELPDVEGYMIDATGTATMTSGFNKYVI